MSQENVELVYRGFDAWTRHDLDEALAGSDPDVEITPVMGPASTTYRGHEGMRTWANDLFSAFPDFSAAVLEARDLGDFVVGTVRIHGQGAGRRVVRADGLVCEPVAWRQAALVSRLRKRGRGRQSRESAGVGDVAGEPRRRGRSPLTVRARKRMREDPCLEPSNASIEVVYRP